MSHNAITTLRTPGNVSPAISDKGLLRGSIGLAIISLVGFGLLYPLAGVGLGQALFPSTANGSLIERDGKVLGSSLVAQPFSDDRYFQSRPSAANYDVMAVAGSNQARTNPDLRKRVDETRAALAQRYGVEPSAIPSDLVTQSAAASTRTSVRKPPPSRLIAWHMRAVFHAMSSKAWCPSIRRESNSVCWASLA